MQAMISIENVSKSFLAKGAEAFTALDDVSMRIRDREFFTLLGPSGCGKTTLLRIIAGFDFPSAGTVRIEGADSSALPPQKRPVNTVFQSYALFPHMTVAENVAFGLQMQKVVKSDRQARVAEALRLVRLESMASRLPGQLSGGQQQRVALARALAPRPKVLLLDEPLSALDLKLRREMQGELKRLQQETGITFILVTHDQEEALAMSDRIAVMSAGRVLQMGAPREIYDNPKSRFVADFIGESNVLPGATVGHGADIMVAVRPERIALSMLASGLPGKIRGTITSITYLGLDTLYEITLDNGERLRSRSRQSISGLDAGQAVILDWPSDAERHLAN